VGWAAWPGGCAGPGLTSPVGTIIASSWSVRVVEPRVLAGADASATASSTAGVAVPGGGRRRRSRPGRAPSHRRRCLSLATLREASDVRLRGSATRPARGSQAQARGPRLADTAPRPATSRRRWAGRGVASSIGTRPVTLTRPLRPHETAALPGKGRTCALVGADVGPRCGTRAAGCRWTPPAVRIAVATRALSTPERHAEYPRRVLGLPAIGRWPATEFLMATKAMDRTSRWSGKPQPCAAVLS
jgi:hypothetical protein